ncbi:uncharacterized protein LOC118741818 [Rhagoletis pomonella]|uniref:uncharacterized protein LOC118741818 n=1 Tax=Rhagoletis pomonella TaxID=28610 RepID=UPI00177CBDB4|nr:uncharacterized protein LOC118741818 [Rhagoletis pomonella]
MNNSLQIGDYIYNFDNVESEEVCENLEGVVVATTPVVDNDDEEKMVELLKEFEMENVLPFLKASQITFRSLKFLRGADLKEAIPPLGLRVEFREKLFMWKKKEFGIDDETMSMPSKVTEWLQKNNFMPSSQSSSSPHCLSKDLPSLLQQTCKGKLILESYKKNQHLTNGNRDDLISIVIDEVIANDIILRGNDFVNLLEQIINLFPNEKGAREYYYIPRKGKKCPSGKLYGKYVNQRSKKRKTIYLEQNTPSPASTKTNPSTKNYEVLEIDFTICRALKASLSRSIADWNEVRDKWQKTFNLRQNDLKELTNIDFLQAWPKYSDSRAPDLIKLDFNIMYPDKEDCLYSKWEMFTEKIQRFYETNLHNDFCKQLFSLAKASTNKE